MIKVMADENDEVFNMTPAVINETVKAARDFLHSEAGKKDYEMLGRVVPRAGMRGSKVEAPVIAASLDWDQTRRRLRSPCTRRRTMNRPSTVLLVLSSQLACKDNPELKLAEVPPSQPTDMQHFHHSPDSCRDNSPNDPRIFV
jgi:hypothetical protein